MLVVPLKQLQSIREDLVAVVQQGRSLTLILCRLVLCSVIFSTVGSITGFLYPSQRKGIVMCRCSPAVKQFTHLSGVQVFFSRYRSVTWTGLPSRKLVVSHSKVTTSALGGNWLERAVTARSYDGRVVTRWVTASLH